MTPAIARARQAKIRFQVHEYEHDAKAASYGLEAAEKLNINPAQVYKTLVVASYRDLIVGVVPVSRQLDLKRLAKAVGVKKVAMADLNAAERATGYVVGGISPLGQKKRLQTIIDDSAHGLDTLYVSAGRRGLEIELSPNDLAMLTGGKFEPIAKE